MGSYNSKSNEGNAIACRVKLYDDMWKNTHDIIHEGVTNIGSKEEGTDICKRVTNDWLIIPNMRGETV